MNLTGKVILDDETMSLLKEEIRETLVEEVATKGYRGSELKKFFLRKTPEDVYDFLKDTIPEILRNVDISDVSNKNKYKALELIQQLLAIRLGY